MKRLIILLSICFLSLQLLAQPSYQQRLYYTCKVWGYAKYFHSEVSTCKVNWDSVLLKFLPAIKTATTSNDFNNVLDSILLAAGPMAIATTPPPATLPLELRRNLNLDWFNDAALRADVKTMLDTIRNNFRPHANCWVKKNDYTTNYYGWLVFSYDSLMWNASTFTAFPNEAERLTILFKYWNILSYFNPYNYVLDISWDTTLSNHVLSIANASDPYELEDAIRRISTALDDAHVEGLTFNNPVFYNKYFFKPRMELRYADGKYIVVNSSISGITRGDAIVSVDGLTPTQWEYKLKPLISAGNPAVFRREVCFYMLGGAQSSVAALVYSDSLNNTHTINASRSVNMYSYSDFYPNDTLKTVKWKAINCDIGYVNMGLLEPNDVSTMYDELKNKAAIIFDIRNYPNGTAWDIAALMLPDRVQFSQLTEPDVNYPGTYSWYYGYAGINNNPTPYQGKAIILMNQETQSHAEYTCMILETLPNVVKIGSQTAGADGNVTWFKLSNDLMQAGFTTLGVYYPNGDNTQRIGIVPDINITPTQAGIRNHRDEVLERALREAGCFPVEVANNKLTTANFKIHPNPVTDILHIECSANSAPLVYTINDITGKALITTTVPANTYKITIDTKELAPGMYFVTLKANGYQKSLKFVKQ